MMPVVSILRIIHSLSRTIVGFFFGCDSEPFISRIGCFETSKTVKLRFDLNAPFSCWDVDLCFKYICFEFY